MEESMSDEPDFICPDTGIPKTVFQDTTLETKICPQCGDSITPEGLALLMDDGETEFDGIINRRIARSVHKLMGPDARTINIPRPRR